MTSNVCLTELEADAAMARVIERRFGNPPEESIHSRPEQGYHALYEHARETE